jgi:hypothetical protein
MSRRLERDGNRTLVDGGWLPLEKEKQKKWDLPHGRALFVDSEQGNYVTLHETKIWKKF